MDAHTQMESAKRDNSWNLLKKQRETILSKKPSVGCTIMRINSKKIEIKCHLFGKFDGIDPPLRQVSKGRSGKILATNEVPGFVPLLRLVKYSEED